MATLLPPLPGLFQDLNSALVACQSVAFGEGYAVVKSRANKDGVGVWKVWLECSRGRWRESTAAEGRCATTRKNDCPFSITIARRWNASLSPWRLVVLDGSHNHPPDVDPIAQPQHRKMSQDTLHQIEVLYRASQRPRDMVKIIIDNNPRVLITRQDVRNQTSRLRVAEMDGLTPIQALLRGLDTFNRDAEGGGYVYWYDTTDGHLDYLMWVHPDSVTLLRSNYELLMADCTYGTNNFNYPLCHITSRTCTGKTFDIGYAFICGEAQESYDMVVECLAQLYRDYCGGVRPNVIITDKEEALKNAFYDSQYFGAVPQIICQFHVWQNVLLMASRYWSLRFGTTAEEEAEILQAKEAFMDSWGAVMYATRDSWEGAWAALEAAYTPIAPALVDYLRSEWMSCRDEILNAFINDHRHYGTCTTSPTESAHFILKHFIQGRGDFLKVVKATHRRVELMVHDINADVAIAMNRNPTESFHPLLDNVRGWIAPDAVRIISYQIERAFEPDREVVDHCACAINLQYGLPCRHSILQNLSNDPAYMISITEVDPHFRFSRTDTGEPPLATSVTGGLLDIIEPAVRLRTRGRPRNDSNRARRNINLQHGTRIRRQPTRTAAQRAAARRAAAADAAQNVVQQNANAENGVEENGAAPAAPAQAGPRRPGRPVGTTASRGRGGSRGRGRGGGPASSAPTQDQAGPPRRGRPVGSRDSYRRVRRRLSGTAHDYD